MGAGALWPPARAFLLVREVPSASWMAVTFLEKIMKAGTLVSCGSPFSEYSVYATTPPCTNCHVRHPTAVSSKSVCVP